VPVTRATTEINAISDSSFEDAIQQGIARATSTLRDVEAAWIKDMNVMIENGNITGYKVNLEITFLLEDTKSLDEPEGPGQRQPARERPQYDAPGELLRRQVLLEDLTQEELDESERFLTLTPAKKGSGRSDISANHDRHLFED
jgi:dodecin